MAAARIILIEDVRVCSHRVIIRQAKGSAAAASKTRPSLRIDHSPPFRSAQKLDCGLLGLNVERASERESVSPILAFSIKMR